MKAFLAAAAIALLATPAAAQTMPIVIYASLPDRDVSRAAPSLQDRIATLAEAACERPFIRNLPARVLYYDCLAEARAQVEAQLADSRPANELALR